MDTIWNLWNGYVPQHAVEDDNSSHEETCDLLADAIIEIEEYGGDPQIGLPFNGSVRTSKIALYDELDECLKILTIARRNLPCYQDLADSVDKINNICSFTTALWLGGIPVVCMSGAFLAQYFQRMFLDEKISRLAELVSDAQSSLDVFMTPYTAVIAKFNALLNDESDKCTSNFNLATTDEYFGNVLRRCDKWQWGAVRGRLWGSLDFALSSSKMIMQLWQRSTSICHGNADDKQDLLKALNQTIVCFEEQKLISIHGESYVKNHAEEKKNLEDSLHVVMNEFEATSNESVINPVLAGISMAAFAVSAGYLVYLFGKKKISRYKLKTEPHKLETCLAAENLNRIINLSYSFRIPLEDISIEELMTEFELAKLDAQPKESLFWLFAYFRQNALPLDIFRSIARQCLVRVQI